MCNTTVAAKDGAGRLLEEWTKNKMWQSHHNVVKHTKKKKS